MSKTHLSVDGRPACGAGKHYSQRTYTSVTDPASSDIDCKSCQRSACHRFGERVAASDFSIGDFLAHDSKFRRITDITDSGYSMGEFWLTVFLDEERVTRLMRRAYYIGRKST